VSRITIFEGPDGSGKSTLARQYAGRTGARYFHHGPCSRVTGNHLLKVYLEMLLPALWGYQDVVLDRAWPSEQVYGSVIRGVDRVGPIGARLLERYALRCEVAVVLCLPPLKICRDVWQRKDRVELYGHKLLARIHAEYQRWWQDACFTELPLITHAVHGHEETLWRELAAVHEHQEAHYTLLGMGGNLLAPVVLVGDEFGPMRNEDLVTRVPFGSFSHAGCGRWLTQQLLVHGIREDQLLWINVDNPQFQDIATEWLMHKSAVYALGKQASQRLYEAGILHVEVEHPRNAKWVCHRRAYELPRLIKEVLDEAD
jgi:hypothetical protein